MTRVLLLFLALVVFANLGNGQHRTPPDADRAKLWNSFAKFIVGDYVIVGRKPDSTVTYTGRLSLHWDGKEFAVTRTIGGDTVQAKGSFDVETGCCDYNTVLRMSFSFDGRLYEATYLWSGDLSNNARLTGYVYLPKSGATKFPGIEALFPLADYNRNVDE
jgi:hypothetical protein